VLLPIELLDIEILRLKGGGVVGTVVDCEVVVAGWDVPFYSTIELPETIKKGSSHPYHEAF